MYGTTLNTGFGIHHLRLDLKLCKDVKLDTKIMSHVKYN